MPAIADKSKYLIIRLARFGCTNRPFYHLVVMKNRQPRNAKPLEHIGTYDPFKNQHGEKLCSVDFNRVMWHLAIGTHLSKSAAQLLGMSGFLPVHPVQYVSAKRNRKKALLEKEQNKEENIES